MKEAKFIQEITITDPDSKAPVQVSIYKEIEGGGMFGIDSSYIQQVFDEDESIIIDSVFANGKIELID